MRIEAIEINNYRSIQQVSLSQCGEFNVLIGKNNSGKSNILASIGNFFACLQSNIVINADPPIKKDDDFFNKLSQSGIQITTSLSLASSEISTLFADIVKEFPQSKTVVDSISTYTIVKITMEFTPPPNNFSYISKIVLRSREQNTTEIVILDISLPAATEIYNRFVEAQAHDKSIESTKNIISSLENDFRFPEGDRNTKAVVNISNIIKRNYEGDSETEQQIRKMYSEAGNMDDFLKSLKFYVNNISSDVGFSQELPIKTNIRTFSGEQPTIPKYITNLIKNISDTRILYFKEQRDPIGKKEADQLLSLKVDRGGEAVLSAIRETVNSLLGVHIDAFRSKPKSRFGVQEAELDVGNFLIEVNGSGIRESLRLILDISLKTPSILLVEEPEIHLHPALETSMMRFLKQVSLSTQVFLTTHSTNFIDTAEMSNMYLVSKPHGTIIQQLNIIEAEEIIPKELGIRLSSLFMYDKLVFVEGNSDEEVLREFASKLPINFSQSNIGFVKMGGVRNFAHFATQATLEFLKKRQVELYFLIDKDERNFGEIAKLEDSLGGNATLKVLEKREIENYLLIPYEVVEFIKLKQKLAGSHIQDVTVENVVHAINECADELKELSIEKHVAWLTCKPFYVTQGQLFNSTDSNIVERISQEMRSLISNIESEIVRIPQVYTENVKCINDNWQMKKLSLVQGDLLIDAVCKRFGVAFKKERDSVRLASFVRTEDIATDIRSFLQKVASPC